MFDLFVEVWFLGLSGRRCCGRGGSRVGSCLAKDGFGGVCVGREDERGEKRREGMQGCRLVWD